MECVANADEILGEMFLEEKVPTNADLKVCSFKDKKKKITSVKCTVEIF